MTVGVEVVDVTVGFGIVGLAVIAALVVALLIVSRRAGTATAYRDGMAAAQAETAAVRARADRLHGNLDVALNDLRDQLADEHRENLKALERIDEQLARLGRTA